MTVLGAAVAAVARDAVYSELKTVCERLRRLAARLGCRVCRAYVLGRRTVGFLLPGRVLIVVHVYARAWVAPPSRLETLAGIANELGRRVRARPRTVLAVAGGHARLSSGARRAAARLGIVVAGSAAALRQVVDFVASYAAAFKLVAGEIGSSLAVALVAARALPATESVKPGPPPG